MPDTTLTAVLDLPTADPQVHGSTPTAGGPSAPPATGFDLLDEIGRGGMGVVYRARDLSLRREVAVKILQEKYAPGSVTAVRFVEEACITGQLQHPGIPAVYQVGKLPDGRPFLAMKLIKGETLESLLRTNAPIDALAVFGAISQAVGYAHAHGVIHRDLKPANVMVGAFGEVQVMDWGLAKVLGDRPGASEAGRDADLDATAAPTAIESLRDTDGNFTQAGSVLGTPAYMPPEQAAGESEKIDTRSDVFGLGAILCVLLTGKPPFEGANAESVRLNAVRGKTESALVRLDASTADPDVIALCKQCLALEPADRPANADAVAGRIAELRKAADDRTRQAERERHAAEVRAAEQARRQRVLAWSAALVVVVLTAGVVASVLQTNRARRAEADVSTQLVKTREAEAAARAKSDELDATLKVISSAGLREGQEKQAIEFYLRLVAIRRRVVDEDPTNIHNRSDLGNALRDLSYTHWRLKQEQQAWEARVQEFAVLQVLASAEPNVPDFQVRLGESYRALGDLKFSLGDKSEALSNYQRGSEIHGRLAASHPANIEYQDYSKSSRWQLAECLNQLGEMRNAQDHFAAVVSLAKKINTLDPVGTAGGLGVAYDNLGVVTRKVGELKEARECFRNALAEYEREAKTNPQAAYRDWQIARCHENIASISLELGDFAAASDSYREALKISRRIAVANPNDTEARRGLWNDLMHLGDVAVAAGDDKTAIDWYEQALAVAAKIERPEQLAMDVGGVRQLLANCRERLSAPSPREIAPPPRLVPYK